MDAEQFRQLLVVGAEFKLKSFKIDNLEVEFGETSHYTKDDKPEQVPANDLDPDQAVLDHIEKLKEQAIGGYKNV
jgi:hypothetical protein